MKLQIAFLLLVFCFPISAQDEILVEQPCVQPLSYKYSEFPFRGIDSSKEKLDEIARVAKENNGSTVVPIVYAGRRSAGHEQSTMTYQISEFMRIQYGFNLSNLWYLEGGFREESYVELFIKPFECSKLPEPKPTLELEEIDFKELENMPKDVFVKTRSQLLATLTKRVEPMRSPNAEALKETGKVAISVIVDKNGKVVRAYSFYGNSYLTTSAEVAVKQWEFSPTKVNNQYVRVGGIVIIEFSQELNNKLISEK